MNPPKNGIRSQSKPISAAEVLREKRAYILRKWEDAVRTEVPAAQSQPTAALRDALPLVLDQMVHALSTATSNANPHPLVRELAVQHGEERAEIPHYTLDQMIWEYYVLHRVLFDILEEKAPLEPLERNIIWDTILVAIRNSASRFAQLRERSTEKVQSQHLEEAEARHALLVESIQDYAIFTLDPRGLITTWNPGCERMNQYTDTEIIGRHFEILYPVEARIRDEPMDHLRKAILNGRHREESLRQKKDGTLYLADVTIIPLYSRGQHAGFGKIVGNLDEKNRLIQERDRSLVEAEDLRIEQILRDRFVAALSHDLRTPLTTAKLSAQIISRDRDSSEVSRKYSSRIVSNLDRMDAMIRDLLDASRIKAGERLSVPIQKCDIREIAAQVRDELTPLHGDRFRLERASPLVGYWGPEGIRRILENLLSNGVKYGLAGTPVTIDLQEVGDRVILSVHNFGKPISAEDQLTLFDPFRRGRSAESGGKPGWGLGLTLVRGYTEAHGGTVRVRSDPEKGTEFIVDLPRDARPKSKAIEGTSITKSLDS